MYTPCSYICQKATDTISDLPDRFYVGVRDFKMQTPIKNPADCEVYAGTHFLIAKGFEAPPEFIVNSVIYIIT